jgi:hypothetical protein
MCLSFAMYIEAVPNRSSPPAILLRESYRQDGKIRKRTLCNLSDWPTAHIEGLRGVLRGGTVISAEHDAFTVTQIVLTIQPIARLPLRNLGLVVRGLSCAAIDRACSSVPPLPR